MISADEPNAGFAVDEPNGVVEVDKLNGAVAVVELNNGAVTGNDSTEVVAVASPTVEPRADDDGDAIGNGGAERYGSSIGIHASLRFSTKISRCESSFGLANDHFDGTFPIMGFPKSSNPKSDNDPSVAFRLRYALPFKLHCVSRPMVYVKSSSSVVGVEAAHPSCRSHNSQSSSFVF